MINIIIADDHPIFRKGLKYVISGSENIKILADFQNGSQALDFILRENPDVAVLDIEMPEMDGMTVLQKCSGSKSTTRIILLTMYKEKDLFDRALDLGAIGYVLKENASEDIIEAIKSAASGKYYISPAVSDFLVRRSSAVSDAIKERPGIESLTAAERQILKLISLNRTSREIADELFISPKTVENHRVNISRKLGLRGANSLLRFAIENKSLLTALK